MFKFDKKLRLGVASVTASALALVAVACGGSSEAVFLSTQLNPPEEAEVVREILATVDGVDVTFTPSEAGPFTTAVQAQDTAGEGTNNVLGAVYGQFSSVNGALMDVSDILDDLSGDRTFAPSLVTAGQVGGQQLYIPWLQAVYTFAAHRDALQYLPSGANVNDLTYDQFIQWGANLEEETGSKQIGFPAGDGGLMHRFIHGYLYPAYTGSVVREFKSSEAVAMWEKFRELWEVVAEDSTTYSHMGEQLAAGDVMVAFDHTARLAPAFQGDNGSDFIIFPAPKGPEGRWVLPVPVGLAVPSTTPDADASQSVIDALTTPDAQSKIFNVSGWVPAVSGSTGSATGVAQTVLDGVNAQAAVSEDGVFPTVMDGGAFSAAYRDTFTQIVLRNMDIESVLATQAEEIDRIFAEGNTECWAPDTPVSGVTCSVN